MWGKLTFFCLNFIDGSYGAVGGSAHAFRTHGLKYRTAMCSSRHLAFVDLLHAETQHGVTLTNLVSFPAFFSTRVPGSLIVLVGTHADCMTQQEAKDRIDAVRRQVCRYCC